MSKPAEREHPNSCRGNLSDAREASNRGRSRRDQARHTRLFSLLTHVDSGNPVQHEGRTGDDSASCSDGNDSPAGRQRSCCRQCQSNRDQ